MSKKRSIAELEAAIKMQEERVKQLRRERARLTQAEEAKLNAKIIRGVRTWIDSQSALTMEDVPDYFYQLADENREKDAAADKGGPGGEVTGELTLQRSSELDLSDHMMDDAIIQSMG